MGKSNGNRSPAEQLRQLVWDSGKPVNQIAREAGIAGPVLHRFMKGTQDITLRTATKLFDYFGLELHQKEEPQ
jgi:hypothetical protein